MATKKKATKKTSTKKTATKKTTARKKTGPKPKPKNPKHVAFLVRCHPDTKQWLEETAQNQGLSREGFVRLLFDTARASWDAHNEKAQQQMFSKLETSIEDMLYRIIGDAVEKAPANNVRNKIGRKT